MKKLNIITILLLLSTFSLWSMEDGILGKRKSPESKEETEQDAGEAVQTSENALKKFRTDEDDQEYDRPVFPMEILLMIINPEDIKEDLADVIRSCNIERVVSACRDYNYLRFISKAFTEILPDLRLSIPLMMHYLPLVRGFFLKAAKAGNVETLKLLCDNGFDSSLEDRLSKRKNWFNKEELRDLEFVKNNLPFGFDLKESDYEDWLISAIGCGERPFCKYLIEKGLFKDVENEPLIYAVILRDKNVVKRLIEEGKGQGMLFGKYTETMLAAACGNVEIFRFFSPWVDRNKFKEGVDKYLTSKQLAARNGHDKIVNILLDVRDDYGTAETYNSKWDTNNSLVAASAKNQIGVVALLLLRADAFINWHSEPSKHTALGEACKNGHREMVALLLEQGANVNKKIGSGNKNALKVACGSGDLEIVKLLLNKGAEIAIDSGWPTLMTAISKGNLELIKLLVENGSQLNPSKKAKWTPLIMAVVIGHIDIVKWLISNNVDVNKLNKAGDTALDMAYKHERVEIAKYLEENGGLRKAELESASSIETELMVEDKDPVLKFLKFD